MSDFIENDHIENELVNDNFELDVTDEYGRKILTLGVFRKLTAMYPDDTQIVVDDMTDWWNNVDLVGVPDPDPEAFRSPYSAISLRPGGGPIDTRQF